MAEVKTVDEKSFEQEVLQADIPVFVDFWAPWCQPCKMLGPIVEALAAENQGKIEVCKVNVDENRELAMKYGIRSIPTMLFFKSGNETKRIIGTQNQSQLQNAVNEVLNN